MLLTAVAPVLLVHNMLCIPEWSCDVPGLLLHMLMIVPCGIEAIWACTVCAIARVMCTNISFLLSSPGLASANRL